jgi:hypothetical protein
VSREVEKARKRARDLFENAARYVLADPRGRHFLWCVLGKTGMNANLMGNNAGQSSWLIGRRDVGLDIERDLTDDLDFLAEWRLMEDEARALIRREAAPVPPPDPGNDEY